MTTVDRSHPDRGVRLEDLDLSSAALFVGYWLAEEVTQRLHAAGYAGLRFVHGFLFQQLIDGSPTVTELAEGQGVTTQAVSQQLRELEDLGYVTRSRDPSDARSRRVTLTMRGQEAVEAARRIRRAVVADLSDQVGHRSIEVCTRTLHACLEALGAADDVAARRVRRPT